MKKIGILILLLAGLTSCYDEYVKDYEYSGVYFTYQTDVRSFVVGEGMKIEVGTALGGVMENNQDRVIQYKVDNSLVTPDALTAMKNGATYINNSVKGVNELLPMPADYFTLSDPSRMIIRKGNHVGTVTVRPDSAKFLSDPKTLQANYVLPLYIESADADSIIEPKRYTVIGLKYENLLFGNYWHGGIRIVKDASGNPIDTVRYDTQIPQPDSRVWELTTVSPFEVETNALSDGSVTGGLRLTINIEDGKIQLKKSSSSKIDVQADGDCFFNKAKLLQNRKIILSYKYSNSDGSTSFVRDTLTFRNRIRDGVNEWQDENPSHYE